MTAGMGFRTLGQVTVFLIVARVLGVADYGAYAAALALATVFGSFGGLGTQSLLVRDVSRDRDSFAVAWWRTLVAVGLSAPILFGIYFPVTRWILPSDIKSSVILFIGLSEIAFAPFVLAAVRAYQGHERINRASKVVFIPILPRLIAAFIFVGLDPWLPAPGRLVLWAVFHAVAAFFTAVYSLQMIRRDFGKIERPPDINFWINLREALFFSVGGAAQRTYADIDKAMLARMAAVEATGAYSAGYRVVDMLTLPLHSLLSAALPRFFQAGKLGVGVAFQSAHRVLPLAFVYSVCAGVVVFLASGTLPTFLGETYEGAVAALRWLAWLPATATPRLVLQVLLIGADRQKQVITIIALGSLLNILMNLYCIPLWDWRGAVAATYLSEIVMTCSMCIAPFVGRKRYHRRQVTWTST